MDKQLIKKDLGFTLIEVMIALAIFGVFITSFMAAQGYNVADSAQIRSEVELRNYAEIKMNQLMYTPIEFSDKLVLKAEEGKLKVNKDFKYKVEYKKFKVPDYNKLKGVEEDEENNPSAAIQKKIFNKVKENMEKMIWQVKVTITNINSTESFSVSTWLLNSKVPIKMDNF